MTCEVVLEPKTDPAAASMDRSEERAPWNKSFKPMKRQWKGAVRRNRKCACPCPFPVSF